MPSTTSNFSVMSLLVFTVFCQLVLCTVASDEKASAQQQQLQYAMENPITAYKRFYSWEDAKRAASIESEEGMRAKRKQFYAWAGKRSAPSSSVFSDGEADNSERLSFEKRKQFYAWAGK